MWPPFGKDGKASKENALTCLAAAASIEVAVSSQEAALAVGPAVIETGGEVCEDGHFGFCGVTFTARGAGCVGVPVAWGSSVPRERSALRVQLRSCKPPAISDLSSPPRS